MSSNTVAIHEGRLIEVRVAAGYRNEAEVELVFQAIAAEIRKRPPGQQFAIVVDWRLCPLLEEKAAERLAQNMAGNNPLVDRSAALVSANSPIGSLQFMRLIRETSFQNRRMFTHVPVLIAWLSEVLNPQEQQRLREFLASG